MRPSCHLPLCKAPATTRAGQLLLCDAHAEVAREQLRGAAQGVAKGLLAAVDRKFPFVGVAFRTASALYAGPANTQTQEPPEEVVIEAEIIK